MKHRSLTDNTVDTMSRQSVPSFEFTPYRYTPLPTPTSVRLLSLIPKEFNKNQATICGQPILACLLDVVDLEQSPTYSALSCSSANPRTKPDISYDPTQKWPISINGRLMFVTKNVYEALNHLQRSAETETVTDLKQGPYAKTRLIEASEGGRVDEVRQLLSEGASVDSQDCFGESSLHYAAENGHLAVVKLLLEHGANKSMLDSSKRTPLACCLQQKRGQWMQVQNALTYHRPTGNAGAKALPQLSQIWIDAICVDQDNLAERRAQSMIMSHIYGYASHLTVWLGATDHETSRAAEILARISDSRDWHGLASGEQEAVCNIVRKHTWFQRNTVAQEIMYARAIEMYSGDYALDWHTLQNVLPAKETEHLQGPRSNFPPAPRYEKGEWGS